MSRYSEIIADPPEFSPGSRFGRLVVVSLRPATRNRGLGLGTLRCDCGEVVEKPMRYVVTSVIRSCGCLAREWSSTLGREHGVHALEPTISHGQTNTPEHDAWLAIRKRCNPERAEEHPGYAGRGITICERWQASFEAFLQDMGKRPGPEYSIDRIDNNGNYEPGNCRWAVRKTQQRNMRSNRLVEFRGETKTVAEWVEILDLNRGAVSERLRQGWSVERALSTPIAHRSPNGEAIWSKRRATRR